MTATLKEKMKDVLFIQFNAPKTLKQCIEQESKKIGLSMSAYIRMALLDFMKKHRDGAKTDSDAPK